MNGYDAQQVRNYADFLSSLSPNELIILTTAIGLILSQPLNDIQAAALGNAFELLAQTIITYGTQEALVNDK